MTVLPTTSVAYGSALWLPVPPLVRYHSLSDGSYAVGRRRALHQHRSVHALLHLPARDLPRDKELHVQFYVEFQSPKALSEYMKDLKSRQVNDSTMKFFSAVKFFKCQPEICLIFFQDSSQAV